jgi:hypothetical protein
MAAAQKVSSATVQRIGKRTITNATGQQRRSLR